MLLILKVFYNSEIRRFRNVAATYGSIASTIASGFGLDLSRMYLRYCDGDRDLCSLTARTTADAITFLDDDNVLRVYVTEKRDDEFHDAGELDSSRQVHSLVACDGCESDPLIGQRFKCTICENFDYCGKCMESNELTIVDHLCRHKLILFGSPDDDNWVDIQAAKPL